MKVRYDARTDTLTLLLREDVAVAESDEDKPGVILDYDAGGNLVAIEVLDASERVTEPRGRPSLSRRTRVAGPRRLHANHALRSDRGVLLRS